MPQPRLRRDRDRFAITAGLNAWLDRAGAVAPEVPAVFLIGDGAALGRVAQDGPTQAYLRVNWFVIAAAAHYWQDQGGPAVIVLSRSGQPVGGVFTIIAAEDIPAGESGRRLRHAIDAADPAASVVVVIGGDPFLASGMPGPAEAAAMLEAAGVAPPEAKHRPE